MVTHTLCTNTKIHSSLLTLCILKVNYRFMDTCTKTKNCNHANYFCNHTNNYCAYTQHSVIKVVAIANLGGGGQALPSPPRPHSPVFPSMGVSCKILLDPVDICVTNIMPIHNTNHATLSHAHWESLGPVINYKQGVYKKVGRGQIQFYPYKKEEGWKVF